MEQSALDFTRPATLSPEVYRAAARQQFVLRQVLGFADRFRPDFSEWLQKNMALWERFEHEAGAIWEAGSRHYSARTIVEWMRHETCAREVGGEFKINGNFVPDLSRLYLLMYPDRGDLFETRGRDAA